MLFRLTLLLLLCILAVPAKAAQPARWSSLAQAEEIQQPSLEQMLSAMLMLGFRGATLKDNEPFANMIKAGKIGNVILFDRDVTEGTQRNINSPDQLRNLTAELRQAGVKFIAVDQEGGQVRRLKPQKGFFDLPSAQAMGQGNLNTTYETADQLGQELKSLGINLDFAPVVDVDVNPFNPAIGRLGRSFGTDPQNVARHALTFGQGLAKNGIVPTLKHFPGQGCATEDTHEGITDISQCWNPDVDLLPYAEIFRKGWPGAVMIGHLFHQGLDVQEPATLSRKIVTGLLREGLGWQGVVITDDLQMKAVSQGKGLKEIFRLAVDAGCDILLLGNNLEFDPELPQKAWTALRELADEGMLTEERARMSWQRITALYATFNK